MKRKADYFGAAIGFIISCLILFGRWIHFQGAGYTIFGFGYKVHKYGGIISFSKVFENVETVAATYYTAHPSCGLYTGLSFRNTFSGKTFYKGDLYISRMMNHM